MKTPKILVLVDKRTGNANQALALASRLDISYKIIKLEYNIFAMLPNFWLKFWPTICIKKTPFDFLDKTNLPDIIISSGRRTGLIAAYLKNRLKDNHNHKAKVIQIMHPNLNEKKFDLIILPKHDNYLNNTSPSNVIRIIGALNNVKNSMNEAKNLLQVHYKGMQNFIAVVIGGSNKKYKFSKNDAETLSDIIRSISNVQNMSLFISFSRRTPKEVKDIFRKKLSLKSNIFYDPEEDNSPNPYPGIMGVGKYIITTIDSISMCSEAASIGKPIYVFYPEKFKLKKHRFFIQELVNLGIVKILKPNTHFLEDYDYQPLNEVDRIVKIIQRKFLTLN